MKFSEALAEGSPFAAREFIEGKDARRLARDLLIMSQEAFSAAFRKSPMKRAQLRGLKRNAAVVSRNVSTTVDVPLLDATLHDNRLRE